MKFRSHLFTIIIFCFSFGALIVDDVNSTNNDYLTCCIAVCNAGGAYGMVHWGNQQGTLTICNCAPFPTPPPGSSVNCSAEGLARRVIYNAVTEHEWRHIYDSNRGFCSPGPTGQSGGCLWLGFALSCINTVECYGYTAEAGALAIQPSQLAWFCCQDDTLHYNLCVAIISTQQHIDRLAVVQSWRNKFCKNLTF